MVHVEMVGKRIHVRDLELDDEEAARILAEHKPEDRPEVVRQALRLGLILRRQASTVANVDFVKLEFKNLQHDMENYWKDEVKNKIDETMTNYFHPDKGIIPKRLVDYFGGPNDGGKLAAMFDEKNTDSVTFKLKQILKEELTGEGSTFRRALDPEDQSSPIGKLKRTILEPIESLKEKVIGQKAAEEMAEAGTQKGSAYENLVFSYIDRIAASFGDKAEDVSNQNVPGDYLITLDPEAVPGQSLKIVIDAKDKTMGLKACEDTLRDSKAQWTGQAAMLVFAREEQTPFSPPVGLRKLGEGYVCVFEKEDLDSRVLQAAYQVIRLEAVRFVQRAAVRIDPSIVQEKLEQAIQKLKDFVTLKKKLTESITELTNIRTFVDSLHRECQDTLEEAWQALGTGKAVPTSAKE